MEHMWWKYVKEETVFYDEIRLGQTLFLQVVKAITKGDLKCRACFNYILNPLFSLKGNSWHSETALLHE